MRKHFTLLNKNCPAIENDIELTEEIKNYILDNRFYRIPKTNINTKEEDIKLNEYETQLKEQKLISDIEKKDLEIENQKLIIEKKDLEIFYLKELNKMYATSIKKCMP
jgi:hypothetical protein